MKILDISRDALTSAVYPGDPETRVLRVGSIEGGNECNLSEVSMCVHTGTHVDAPLHFLEEGDPVDKIPLECFIGECTVAEVRQGPITGEWVENYFPRRCERVLIKSGGRAWFMDSAAEAAASLGIKLIGTDAISIGCSGAQIKPHKAFLSKGIAILESLCLDNVEPGNYFLIAPPVKMCGIEAAPVRALLIADHLFWGRK